ncbi:hypothetical protein [Peribacillus deserti]|nr:hypothetical protein [Peribacillus deserti]
MEEAIQENENLIKPLQKNSWVQRETFVLRELKKLNLEGVR